MSDAVRVAMWSGPRNISTAMMRSFENREDTAVIDEPFYVPFLAKTGLRHPMRSEILASRSADAETVIEELLGPVPDGRSIFYQKQMTHHILPEFRRDWMAACRHAFLIRSPEKVLASYVKKRVSVTESDIGFFLQSELFEEEAQRLGAPPPVIDAEDVLADPRAALSTLCQALGISFSDRMLQWPTGKRATDGVWASVWYGAVERSTGFAPSARQAEPLPTALQKIADAVRPHYEYLARFKLSPSATDQIHKAV